MIDDNADIVKEFLMESYENLDQLDRDLVALETDPMAADRIASIFRTIHTIKGTCGILGFTKLESVAHVGENLLSRLREGELRINEPITSALLKMVDAVRAILGHIESGTGEGDDDYSSLITTLKQLNSSTPADAREEQPQGSVDSHDAAPAPAILAETLAVTEVAVDTIDEHSEAAGDHDHAASSSSNTPAAPTAGSAPNSVSANAIRVDVGLLDQLMNLVGELVLARNQILQHSVGREDAAFLGTTQRLNLITTELQESVMKTRMQPIGGVWNKFPRLVRDLAQSCGKRVRIEMEGRETELDKTIIEAIKDPLTHVIRNSIDHGIETPEQRAKAGKDQEGVLLMRAFHEGGQVNIEISDDGNGIDPERVKRKAVEKRLITLEQSGRLTEREAISLIFLPGFSTAERITNVSGRGVGMDVVKTNIERIGGTVDIVSRLGAGTTLKIKIPLTLAIIPALIVSSGGERFAIPQVSLLELVRIEQNDTAIEMIQGTPVYRLRGNLLPLVDLTRELELGKPGDKETGASRQGANIVVLRGAERQFGLVVDHVNDTEEIVVKPLSKQLKALSIFAGATIMGDGRVALILDVVGLAQRSNVIASQVAETQAHESGRPAHIDAVGKQTLLLVRLADDRRLAIPLSLVARLEEFAPASIESAGDQRVVQYRGQIMTLIDVASELRVGGRAAAPPAIVEADSDMIQVVVYTIAQRDVGLVVRQILDVVEEQIVPQPAAARRGVLGTAVIKERVTELLDVPALVAAGARQAA